MHMKHKLYASCVQSVMVYAVKFGPLKMISVKRLKEAEKNMMRCMCNATVRDGTTSLELRSRYGTECISEMMRRTEVIWPCGEKT